MYMEMLMNAGRGNEINTNDWNENLQNSILRYEYIVRIAEDPLLYFSLIMQRSPTRIQNVSSSTKY